MTKTPKCPYCGAEMELHNIPDQLIPDSLWWYQCDCCGATAPSDEEPASALAAALRRAEPENWVLTLEELKEHCKNPDAPPLWVEYREKPEISRWMLANAPDDVMDFPLMSKWIEIERIVATYLRKWRCWLRKPTAEEMGREKWDAN